MHKIWPGRRAHWVKYESTNNSDLHGMSLASFCQSRAVLFREVLHTLVVAMLGKNIYSGHNFLTLY